MSGRRRDSEGRYKAHATPWAPDRWNDGFVDIRGRFRVYRPDCPRAYGNGWALRAHVVWWLHTGEAHPRTHELHHKNEDRLDDHIENLEVLTNSDHQRRHKPTAMVTIVCEHCARPAQKKLHRLRYKYNFCSHACYSAHPKSPESRARKSAALRLAWEKRR